MLVRIAFYIFFNVKTFGAEVEFIEIFILVNVFFGSREQKISVCKVFGFAHEQSQY